MVWCGVVWCGVVWCGVVLCGVEWSGVEWYVVRCGVMCCGVRFVLLRDMRNAMRSQHCKCLGFAVCGLDSRIYVSSSLHDGDDDEGATSTGGSRRLSICSELKR